MEKPIGVFNGGTFKEVIRQYSTERMKRDPRYRRGVFKVLEQRRKDKKTDK